MKDKRVGHLLFVIFSGVIVAFVLSIAVAFFYGPSGKYEVKKALISPDLVTKMTYNAPNPKTGGTSRFIFDKIEAGFVDPSTKKLIVKPVSQELYQHIYDLISADSSLLNPPDDVIQYFKEDNPEITIKIYVHTESSAEWQKETRVFQSIEFAKNGNFYRIKLHEEKTPDGEWIYFHHPHISHRILPLLSENSGTGTGTLTGTYASRKSTFLCAICSCP